MLEVDMNLNKKKIKRANIISFDIFETLIMRTFNRPQEVFRAVNRVCGEKVENFQNIRLQAELQARKNSNTEEVSLDDIYKYIPFQTEALREKYKKNEIQMEEAVCVPNPEVIDLFKYCRDMGKKVILITDMYLSKNIIEKILMSCGIKGYDSLYVSSEIGLTKSTGDLYKFILSKEKVPKNKILHIGNNIKSDFLIPKKLGIKAYKYNYSHTLIQTDSVSEALLLGYCGKRTNKKDFFYNFGYSFLGPAIYGYTKWIYDELNKLDINKVFFFAREGKFIKRAFDCQDFKGIEEKYVYVSRRSLTVPALNSTKRLEDFLALRPIRNQVTVREELEKLGLTVKDIKNNNVLNTESTFLNKKFGDMDTANKKSIEEELFMVAKKYSSSETELAIKYLKQEGFKNKFAIVDIGWNGSMQRALVNILNNAGVKFDMTGFFVAQRDEFYKNSKYIKNKGYLFDYNKVSSEENLLLNSGTPLLEFLFSADHGSTLKYKENKDGKIIPVLDRYEYTGVWPLIKKIQDAAIDFVNDYSNSNHNFRIQNTKSFFLPMYSVLKNPSSEVVNTFGDINVSDMNEVDLKLAPKVKITKYNQFISMFEKAPWKVAFLKRNLHLKHAFELYSFLRNRFN
ncbi:hypothetical protein EFS45_09340 [Lactobacillus crispatus]|nr:hypothetical protein [Lactobacillus crispatus]